MKTPEPRYIGGYESKHEIFSMDTAKFIDFCTGHVIMAIASGQFRDAIRNTIDMATDKTFAQRCGFQYVDANVFFA